MIWTGRAGKRKTTSPAGEEGNFARVFQKYSNHEMSMIYNTPIGMIRQLTDVHVTPIAIGVICFTKFIRRT